MSPNAAALRRAELSLAKAEFDDYTRAALQLAGEKLDLDATPEQLARTHATVRTYLQLAGAALDRFQEAARGT